jgi:hypothetical protein
MLVPFAAYAEDSTFTGEVALTGDRLSDFLASTVEFEVVNLSFRALDDGRVVDALHAPVLRDDLCLVLAGEPRGREELRVWTRQFAVVASVGPYVVRGYVHAPPTIDPMKLPSRRTIVALTAGSITYVEAGTTREIEAETVLVNSSRIERFEPAMAEEIDRGAIFETGPDGGEAPEAAEPATREPAADPGA